MAGTIKLLNSSSFIVQSQESLYQVYLSNNRNNLYYFKTGAVLGRIERAREDRYLGSAREDRYFF